MITNEARFYRLIADSLAQDFSGWDFSYLKNRCYEMQPHWDYAALVRQYKTNVQSMLDLGTGGGEFLSTLAPFPPLTVATEGWELNLPIAQKRLEPLGIQVKSYDKEAQLPFADETFDLVINRHEFYKPVEIYRILKPGGWFITQQVGRYNYVELKALITGEKSSDTGWTVANAAQEFANSGFKVLQAEEAFPSSTYKDIGAIVYYLKVVSWAIPDFAVHKHIVNLADLHNRMEHEGSVTMKTHRYYIEVQKPAHS